MNHNTSCKAKYCKFDFRDCTGLPNLTIGNSIKYGMNAITTGVSSLSAVGLSLGGSATTLIKGNGTTTPGTNTQFIKGDASLDSTVYNKVQVYGSGSQVGITETSISSTVNYGSWTWADSIGGIKKNFCFWFILPYINCW